MDVEADSLAERSEVDWLQESDFETDVDARDSEQDVHCEADRLSETDRENDPDSETCDAATTLEVEEDWLVETEA